VISLRCIIAAPLPSGQCQEPPETPLGLCLRHLGEAAAEYARMTGQSDGRPSSVRFEDLCARCGRPGHDPRTCDA